MAQNGTTCSQQVCQTIHVGDQLCIDPSTIDTNIACPAVFDPVCGCDSITYPNACEAQYRYGVTSWTPGACATRCFDPAWFNPLVLCAEIYDPVCGCDDVTYQNECIALYLYGITSWIKGPCCPPQDCKALFEVEKLTDRTVVLWDASEQSDNWMLDFGDGVVHTGPFDTLSHQYAVPGIYQICLDIANVGGSCTDKYCTLVDFRSTGTNNPIDIASVLVYPNPA
ncbi:MAG: Kazal-type serine protease inhibitor domain-containing protein, partial [Saprospiraceae bacterium]